MGPAIGVLQNTCHLIRPTANRKCLTQRLPVTEILPSHRFRKNNGIGLLKRRSRITFDQGKIEDLENIRIREQEVLFVELYVLISNQHFCIISVKPDGINHDRIILDESRSRRVLCYRDPSRSSFYTYLLGMPENSIRVFMVPAIAQFILNIE